MTTEVVKSEVRGKAGGFVELECTFPPPVPATASLHVVEWVRQGFDIPVLIKFGSYAPRVHPQFEGKHLSSGEVVIAVNVNYYLKVNHLVL